MIVTTLTVSSWFAMLATIAVDDLKPLFAN